MDPSTCWNEQNKAYYIYKGSARIEIFVSSHPENNGTTRHYLRIFSGLMKVPETNKTFLPSLPRGERSEPWGTCQLTLVPNTAPDNDWLYATYERDIQGYRLQPDRDLHQRYGTLGRLAGRPAEKFEFGEGGSPRFTQLM